MTISGAIRETLSERAGQRCEYCLLSEAASIKRHEPDHIIPKKHGGEDELDNLAWSCFQCNRYKGSEVAAFDTETGELTQLFNPRRHQWKAHFSVDSGQIVPKSRIGRVTILILQLNRPGRIAVRAKLAASGNYP
ncbi:HNH endonuclease [Candidatus Leptofilum sp.]|uniref:HNH endonuclease n=1 Tax=Candidatus Leptofilum sp. TaxID=3241576 RepID=UPI003B5BA68E